MTMVRVSPGVYRDDSSTTNPLMNKPYIGPAPAKAPMTPAEVAALMLKQRQEEALRTTKTNEPKTTESKSTGDQIKSAATNYAINQGIKYGANYLLGTGGTAAATGTAAGTGATAGTAAGAGAAGAGTAGGAAAGAGAAGTGAAGAGTAAGAGGAAAGGTAAGGTAAGGAGAGLASGAATGATAAIAAYAAYQSYLNIKKGRPKEAALWGSALGIGPAISAGYLATTGSNKSKDQYRRDSVRDGYKDIGLVDEGYNVTNADGSKYDIGKDGGDPRYNVDFSREGIGDIVGAVNPLAALDSGGDDQLTSDFAGYHANAAASSGNWQDNVRGYFDQRGLDHEKATAGVNQLFAEEAIDAPTRDAYLASLDKTFGVGQPQQPVMAGGGGGGGIRPAPRPQLIVNPKHPNALAVPAASAPAPAPAPISAPAPVAPLPPQPAAVSEDDYIKAILAVQGANAPRTPPNDNNNLSVNPLARRLY